MGTASSRAAQCSLASSQSTKSKARNESGYVLRRRRCDPTGTYSIGIEGLVYVTANRSPAFHSCTYPRVRLNGFPQYPG
jgi:hypothetical protein